MTVLITGGENSLSLELKKIYSNALIPTKELDLSNKANIESFFKKNKFDTIIHNESLLNVRLCEDEKELALKVNVTHTKNLVDVLQNKNCNIQFLHISTPCIFDGFDGMYAESSPAKPVNFYGQTRLMAEKEVSKLSNYSILRTNYVSKEKWPYPKAFSDRFGTYLFPKQVAQGIYDIQTDGKKGIIHIVGDRKISMFELAKIMTPEIQSMTIDDYFGPPLTMDMSLDSKKWKKYTISIE
ncbi:NAD(P)-dependent oxidoreductase [Nitrosopumilus cobalaminigenes]|uniref:NAD(P)-dependent oxidoreductase n=1 Tax=Nitrosopumilus cobalaminigenes TaxID=1470066 RepID=A0A7D5R506_9ARCH|nr:sugar nucleotide-binding protein [Nitrosopumilus cobalaminigenes]QLH02204.1 NAD(P)-dependent oxidoreductase [Nitrosopumilus cobalaminigenes]